MIIQVCTGFFVGGLYSIQGFRLHVSFKKASSLYWFKHTWERLHYRTCTSKGVQFLAIIYYTARRLQHNFSPSCTMNKNRSYFYLKGHDKNNLQLKSELCQPKNKASCYMISSQCHLC